MNPEDIQDTLAAIVVKYLYLLRAYAFYLLDWFHRADFATVTTIAAAVAAIAAVFNAWATSKTVKEMKAQREQSLRPLLDLVVPKATQYKYIRGEDVSQPLLGSIGIFDSKSYSFHLDSIRFAELVNLSKGVARRISVKWEIISPTLTELVTYCIELNKLNAAYNERDFRFSISFITYIDSSGGKVENEHYYTMYERGPGRVISESSLSQVDYCVPVGASKYRYFIELPEPLEHYFHLCALYACEKQDADQVQPTARMQSVNIGVVRIMLKYFGLAGC